MRIEHAGIVIILAGMVIAATGCGDDENSDYDRQAAMEQHCRMEMLCGIGEVNEAQVDNCIQDIEDDKKEADQYDVYLKCLDEECDGLTECDEWEPCYLECDGRIQ